MEYVKDELREAKHQLEQDLQITNEDLAQLEARVMKKLNVKKRPIRWVTTAVAALVILGVGIPLASQTVGQYTTHSGAANGQTQQSRQAMNQNQSAEPKPGDTMIDDGVVQKYGAYVIHNNSYYSATGTEVSPNQLDGYIGPVKRIGDWSIKREGDSNFFAPQITLMYQQKGVDPNKQIILKIRRNSIGEKAPNDAYKYEVFKNVAPVGKLDTTKIFTAKTDPQEVGYALQNIARVYPNFYEFKDLGSRAVPFSAALTSGSNAPYDGTSNSSGAPANLSTATVNLQYLVKEANTPLPQGGAIEGIINVLENADNQGHPQNSGVSKDSPSSIQKEYDLNGLHWQKYNDGTYLGHRGNQYYQITVQGKLGDDKMMEFLQHFQPSSK